MTNRVLIAGASGLVGFAALKLFSSLPNWEALALSRRRPPELFNARFIPADLMDDTRPRRADQRIRAVAAARDVAKQLEVPPRSPVLQTERLTFDERNVRIEFARSWMRPDLELTIHLER